MRTELHNGCNALAKRFHRYVKLPIPYELFPEPIDDKIIQRILKTTYVEAFVPYFHDETQSEPDHYVLFILSNFETIYITLQTLHKTLKDFPPHVVQPPPTPVSKNNVSQPKPLYQEFFDEDLAFLQQLANSDTPTSPQVTSINSDSPSDQTHQQLIPHQITTKRPHHPTGYTVTPQRQKAKSLAPHSRHHHPSSFHPSFHPPDDTMDVEQLAPGSTEQEHSTLTSDTDSNLFGDEHQPETPELPTEFIPDDQYAFDLSHSQPTRIEVMDTLAITKAISQQHYQKALDYVKSHKNINVDHLKSLTSTSRRAHNDSKAPSMQPP
jgi:hypothetical protein